MPKRPVTEDQVNVVVRFPVELHERTKDLAQDEDLSMSQLVRRAVRLYLEQGPRLSNAG